MVEVVVISGKGGTGKTSLTASLAHLAGPEKIICDLDVDAPDLHLILQPEIEVTEDFYSGHEAIIDPDRCTGCGLCQQKCRYGAINQDGDVYAIDPIRCEGCKVCVTLCPDQAIDFNPAHCGRWYRSNTRFGPMIHAQLFPGQENSGRLVALLRQQAKEQAEARGFDLILSDGTPGIGCPVISSVTGADLVVIVTEPTVSGRHDMERVLDLTRHFDIPAGLVINKSTLNPDAAREIENFGRERGVPILAKIPYDRSVVEAMTAAKTITEYSTEGPAKELGRLWNGVSDMIHDIELKRSA